MLANLIREVTTESEVFALVNTFIEASRACGKLSHLPAQVATPVSDFNNLLQRCLSLLGELDSASKRHDEPVCAVIKETLHVFSAALERLKAIERGNRRSSSPRYSRNFEHSQTGSRTPAETVLG